MAPLAEKAIQLALHEIPASSHLFQAPVPVAKQTEQERLRELYGLYYVDLGEQGSGETALVISTGGKPIAPKENDPDAPTEPGIHTNGQHFKFAWSQLTLQDSSFRTVNVNRSEYSFQGRFGRERVDEIPDVPYLEGVLTEKRDSNILRAKKVHFGHAVIF